MAGRSHKLIELDDRSIAERVKAALRRVQQDVDGRIVIKKLVININCPHGGGATVNVREE